MGAHVRVGWVGKVTRVKGEFRARIYVEAGGVKIGQMGEVGSGGRVSGIYPLEACYLLLWITDFDVRDGLCGVLVGTIDEPWWTFLTKRGVKRDVEVKRHYSVSMPLESPWPNYQSGGFRAWRWVFGVGVDVGVRGVAERCGPEGQLKWGEVVVSTLCCRCMVGAYMLRYEDWDWRRVAQRHGQRGLG
ncbi:hypothetical protein Tco_1231407 [Tanacetum coccineum]